MISIKNLAQATAQQVLDQAFNHLMTQNQKAAYFDDFGKMISCKYRMKKSPLKCGAGCFIAEEEYDERMEGQTWNGLVEMGLVNTEAHLKLIMDIQAIHDSFSVESWPDHFMRLAERHNLIYPMVLTDPVNVYKGLADTIEINITR
jgi:hypothetical protein